MKVNLRSKPPEEYPEHGIGEENRGAGQHELEPEARGGGPAFRIKARAHRCHYRKQSAGQKCSLQRPKIGFEHYGCPSDNPLLGEVVRGIVSLSTTHPSA